jgi:hypothetical protein
LDPDFFSLSFLCLRENNKKGPPRKDGKKKRVDRSDVCPSLGLDDPDDDGNTHRPLPTTSRIKQASVKLNASTLSVSLSASREKKMEDNNKKREDRVS